MSTKVKISGLTVGGATIGTIVEGDPSQVGKRAFVNFAAPGEAVTVQIKKDTNAFVEAELLSIDTPSSERITPPCPYFGRCGGCHYQHLTIRAQRDGKRELVEETLRRQGGIEVVDGVHLVGEGLPEYGYRRKVSLHFTKDGKLGFHQPKSHTIVPISKCLIASDKVNALIPLVQSTFECHGHIIQTIVIEEQGDRMKVIVHPRQRKFRSELKNLLKDVQSTVWFDVMMAGSRENNDIPAGSFFQINDEGNLLLQELVLSFCKQSSQTEVTELFAGGGNFSFPMAQAGLKVHAVEADKELVRFGTQRAEQLKIQLDFTAAQCEDFIKKAKFSPLVLLDPPRCGAKEVCEAIMKQDVKAVVYVSCSLPTVCRDFKILKEGGFTVQKVFVVDMFSQTHHVETVSYLVRH